MWYSISADSCCGDLRRSLTVPDIVPSIQAVFFFFLVFLDYQFCLEDPRLCSSISSRIHARTQTQRFSFVSSFGVPRAFQYTNKRMTPKAALRDRTDIGFLLGHCTRKEAISCNQADARFNKEPGKGRQIATLIMHITFIRHPTIADSHRVYL